MTGDDNEYCMDDGDESAGAASAEVKRPSLSSAARVPRLSFRVSGARAGDAARPAPAIGGRAQLLPSRRRGLRIHGTALPKTDDEAAS